MHKKTKKKLRKKTKKTRRSSSSKKQTALVQMKEVEESIGPAAIPSTQDNLPAYLNSLRHFPLLNREQEKVIAVRYYEKKDPKAAQLLVVSNLRLVVKIAGDYVRSGISLLDLIQEGNIGLLQAVKAYDPYRNVKFSSYASYWIKAYIRSFILRNWSLVKMGTTRAQRTLFYRLQKEKNQLETMGIVPETKYLAEKFDVKEKEINEMSQRLSGHDLSLNTPLYSQSSSSLTRMQLLESKAPLVDEQLAEQEIQTEFGERLDKFETTLSGKELVIFRERMRADKPKTLQEIANVYGVTRERVRQIESRVLEKLKDYMQKNARFMENVIDV